MKNRTPIHFAILLSFFAAGCSTDQKQGTMEKQAQTKGTKTTTVRSKDGTTIAYEKSGSGPCIIVVNGALSHRSSPGVKELAALLATNFTVIVYDRRGRGESTETKPYRVQREIEDLEALVQEAGGSAYLVGSSSGAALALLAAEKLGPEKVKKLALYEPPYGAGTTEEYATEKDKVNGLVADGKPGVAVAFFMERRGTPPDKMKAMKTSPEWSDMESMGHTLVYDFEVMGDGTVPVDVAKNIAIPTLVMTGEKSVEFMHATAETIRKSIPGAVRKTLKGQSHNASPEAIAPVLTAFFVPDQQ